MSEELVPHATTDLTSRAGGLLPLGDSDVSAEISAFGLLNVLLRRRRLLLVTPVLVTLLVVGFSIVFPSYDSESSLMANTTSTGGSQLAGLAAQFGVNVAGLGSGSTIDFYGDLVTSRAALVDALTATYRFPTSVGGTDTISGSLLDLLDISGSNAQDRLNRGVDKLGNRISLGKDEAGGVLGVRVTMPWAILSEQVNRRLLEFANHINTEQLQSQAHAERLFIETRLHQAQQELQNAEADMRNFLERNRTYAGSPRLKFDADQIQRHIDLSQGVYLSLAQSYEQARIEEVRDTPVFTLVDAPEGSGARPHAWSLVVAIGLILGAMVAVVLAFGLEYLARERTREAAEQVEFRRLVLELKAMVSPRRIVEYVRRRRSR